VFTVNEDHESSGMLDAGIALLDAYNYIAEKKDPYDAMAFITDVFAKVGDSEEVGASDVHDLFMQNYKVNCNLMR
jgi:hypothetical protein